MKLGLMSFSVAFALISVLPLSAGAYAQEKTEPITIVSHVDTKPDSAMQEASGTAAKLFRAETAATKQDAGLISYVVFQETGAHNHFTIVETWRDQKSYELHVASEHTVKFRQGMQPFLGSPFDSRVHHQFQ